MHQKQIMPCDARKWPLLFFTVSGVAACAGVQGSCLAQRAECEGGLDLLGQHLL
jgi:hypothetical protein